MKIVKDDHFPPIIENTIIGLIILVVIFTIVEDLAMVYNWPHKSIVTIAIIGFIFDLFFTAEFAARSIISAKSGHFLHYIKYQRGWIDAISSFPLLLLVSGPAVLYYLTSNGAEGSALTFLSVLKTAKAIRVTRILRLIRIVKIFGKIQNTESVMTNRHVGIISTINVVVLVVVLVMAQFMPFLSVGDATEYLKKRKFELQVLFSEVHKGITPESIVNVLRKSGRETDIIILKDINDKIRYEHPDKENLIWKSYDHGNFIQLGAGYSAVISHHIPDSAHARENMVIFLAILGLILSMMFIYSTTFAKQIADPAFIMEKGFKEWNYNLEVSIPEHFARDEIMRTAKSYNEQWLPLKNQIYSHRMKKMVKKSDLKIDDIFS